MVHSYTLWSTEHKLVTDRPLELYIFGAKGNYKSNSHDN